MAKGYYGDQDFQMSSSDSFAVQIGIEELFVIRFGLRHLRIEVAGTAALVEYLGDSRG